MQAVSAIPLILSLKLYFLGAFGKAAEIQKELDKITTTESSHRWCPAPKIGVECPSGSVFHFYKCCGQTLSQCCFQIQMWVIVLLIVLGVIFLSSLLLFIIRCIFCRRK